MRHAPIAVAAASLLALSCVDPATRTPVSREPATVVGSLVVELERPAAGAERGLLTEDLALTRPGYRFHFTGADRSWSAPTPEVDVAWGEPRPFVVGLRGGRAQLEELEIVLDDGPSRWLLRAISAIDGKRLPIDLAFDVSPDRITYIGRIQVVLPRHLKILSSQPPRVTVFDAGADDRRSLRALLDHSALPVTTALARAERRP